MHCRGLCHLLGFMESYEQCVLRKNCNNLRWRLFDMHVCWSLIGQVWARGSCRTCYRWCEAAPEGSKRKTQLSYLSITGGRRRRWRVDGMLDLEGSCLLMRLSSWLMYRPTGLLLSRDGVAGSLFCFWKFFSGSYVSICLMTSWTCLPHLWCSW